MCLVLKEVHIDASSKEVLSLKSELAAAQKQNELLKTKFDSLSVYCKQYRSLYEQLNEVLTENHQIAQQFKLEGICFSHSQSTNFLLKYLS